jgi:hypothetical protein
MKMTESSMYAGDVASYITWQNFALCIPLSRTVHSGRLNTKHHMAGCITEGAATVILKK